MPDHAAGPRRISVVGIVGGQLGDLSDAAARSLERADTVIGAKRHLEALETTPGLGMGCVGRRTLALEGDVDRVMEAVAAETGEVCVLASGDPGFFGIVRPLAERFGSCRLDVHPSPSSVSLAFARLGIPWDDAVVVSAHGRPLGLAAHAIVRASRLHNKVAVLVSRDAPPERVARALLRLGAPFDQAAVCARLGTAEESVERMSLHELAAGAWDPLSIVVLLRGSGVGERPSLAWGSAETAFAHRDGMITKSEARAVVISKLGPPLHGDMWDVGAGSGSVGIECAQLSPELRVIAVEGDAEQAGRIKENARAHAVEVEVVHGRAPEALRDLPVPDCAFVGGGGLAVLDCVLERLRPGGVVVAAYTALDRAAQAHDRLGSLAEIGVSRARPLRGGSVRLVAENPVFIAWGPARDEASRDEL